ncbi:hypothetical protein KY334_06600 [Candidatus Woesearchaeota archaeon]|nr:hypothetical protein [Candidatus Woesearchaeota archaeon]
MAKESLDKVLEEVSDLFNEYIDRNNIKLSNMTDGFYKEMDFNSESSLLGYFAALKNKRFEVIKIISDKEKEAKRLSLILETIFIDSENDIIQKLKEHYEDFEYPINRSKVKFVKSIEDFRLPRRELRIIIKTDEYLKNLKDYFPNVYEYHQDLADRIFINSRYLLDLRNERIKKSRDLINENVKHSYPTSKVDLHKQKISKDNKLLTLNNKYLGQLRKQFKYSAEETDVLQNIVNLVSSIPYRK